MRSIYSSGDHPEVVVVRDVTSGFRYMGTCNLYEVLRLQECLHFLKIRKIFKSHNHFTRLETCASFYQTLRACIDMHMIVMSKTLEGAV